jgi:capsular polysaccharide biosynthesis protein
MPGHRTLDVPKVVPEGLSPRHDGAAAGSDPSLVDWLRVVLDGWKALAISVAVGLALGVLATLLQAEQYKATGSVVVTPAKFLDPNSADQLPTLTNTVQRLAGTTAVLAPAAREYVRLARNGVTRAQRRSVASPDWLSKHLSVAQQGDSSIIEISGVGATQVDAVDLTKSTVTTLARVVNSFGIPTKVASGADAGSDGISIKVFTLARERGQVSPTPVRNVLVGANVGLIVGIVAALLLGISRHRLRRTVDISEELGVPVLGEIGVRGGSLDADPGFFEAATALERAWGQSARALVLLTGTVDARSLALVAAALVRALERVGMRAVLVDANDEIAVAGVSSEDEVLVRIHGGSRWSQSVAVPQPDAPRPGVALEQAAATDAVVIVAGPSLDQPGELVRLVHTADHAIVVAHRGVSPDDLRSARMLEPKIVGALVVG